MEEITNEIDRLMKRWIYIGTAATILLMISIILFYYEKRLLQFVLILAQLTIIYISITGYIFLKKEKKSWKNVNLNN